MAAAAGLLGLQLGFNQVDNCGIVGYIGNDASHQSSAVDILMEGLTILQNRGYDSCGVATISDEGKISSTKYASKGSTSDSIQILGREVTKKHAGHMMGIAHTRWATHGGRTTGCGVYSHAGREQAVASTKAFVTQVTVLSLIAAWFSEHREKAGHLDQDYSSRRDRLVE